MGQGDKNPLPFFFICTKGNMNKEIELELGEVKIHITVNNGGGNITTNLHHMDDEFLTGAVEMLESLILAQACAGIDVESEAYKNALQVALDWLANSL
jgi:hypothetical protein